MTVGLILVNWNSGALLNRCLESIARQTLLPQTIIIVDNGSEDDSCACVADYSELPIVVLRQNENLGFAKANNIAFAHCQDVDFFALLNVDAIAEENWLSALMHAAQANPAYGSYASCMLMEDLPERFDGTGDVYHISGLAWRRHHGAAYDPQARLSVDVFAPCAGAALYRRRVVQQLGGFDEDLFCYFEDVDLGLRMRLSGLPCCYVANARVRHMGGGLVKDNSVALYYGHRNLVWVFVKNMPALLLLLLLPLHLLQNLFVLAALSLRGDAATIFRAKRDALGGIKLFWKKRAGTTQKISSLELLKCFQISPSRRLSG